MKTLFQQTWAQIKAQPLMSAISVIGTALAIFLVMTVIMLRQVRVAPFPPESGRDRFLHYSSGSIHYMDWSESESSNGPLGIVTIREVFDQLATPEAVAVYKCMAYAVPVSLPGQPSVNADLQETNTGFWRVFDFDFVTGNPYTQAQFDAGAPVAVVAESIARRLFGNTDIVGRDILINHVSYRICGVVRDVSTLAGTAYAQIWIPYMSTSTPDDGWCDNFMGYFSVTMLAKNRADFPEIRNELLSKFADFEQSHPDISFIQRNRPYDQRVNSIAFAANQEPSVAQDRQRQLIILAILLIVPAINLSSMTHSRLRQRVSEIGVRRAFGCRRSQIMTQMIMENFLVTLVAGVIGLGLTVIFSYIFNVSLYTADFSYVIAAPMIDMRMLIQPSTIVWTLGLCFVLNLMSSGFPAWMASRTDVVDALRGK